MNDIVIPTFTDIDTTNPRWQAMIDWLTANGIKCAMVPIDSTIVIRDGSCLGIECYVADTLGRKIWNESTGAERRTEWHPLIVQPPTILLPS